MWIHCFDFDMNYVSTYTPLLPVPNRSRQATSQAAKLDRNNLGNRHFGGSMRFMTLVVWKS
jgi:hypothetical protein